MQDKEKSRVLTGQRQKQKTKGTTPSPKILPRTTRVFKSDMARIFAIRCEVGERPLFYLRGCLGDSDGLIRCPFCGGEIFLNDGFCTCLSCNKVSGMDVIGLLATAAGVSGDVIAQTRAAGRLIAERMWLA